MSIIGPEFQQNTSEAVLVTKEDIWTRYFFFFEDGLYKMFLGFNKDAIGGKSFQEFGKSMEAKYGNGREVYRDDKTKGGVAHKLDHYEWSAGGGDRLRLIDRSEFYGVYCLVLYDGAVQDRVMERRKVVNPGEVKRDELVEGVTGAKNSRRVPTSTTTSSTASSARRPRSRAPSRRARRSSSTPPTCPRRRRAPRARAAAKRRRRWATRPRLPRRPKRRTAARRRAARRAATTRWTGWSSSRQSQPLGGQRKREGLGALPFFYGQAHR